MKVGESNRNGALACFFIFTRHLLPYPGVCTSTDVNYGELKASGLLFVCLNGMKVATTRAVSGGHC